MGVVVDCTGTAGWDRLILIADLRDARDAGLVRWHDGHVQVRPGLSAELRARMADHPDVLAHALTYDLEELTMKPTPIQVMSEHSDSGRPL